MTQIGTIELIATINTAQYKKGANEIEKANSDIEKSSDKASKNTARAFSANLSDSFGRIADGLANIAKKALILGVSGSVGIGAMAKASWDQVGAVQQATVGLRAYEKNASKVDSVLSSLVSYARSDMGVLFNRKDLFQSAQMLKLNGVATENLTDNVKILSRSVGLGLGNWQDLNAVVGRVVSTGRLSGIEFDQLTQYGFKLDKSLRNTNVSATQLFQALDKGIPTDALAGQANTIEGMNIRLQSAFRNLGDAILGVDKDTGQFVKGGLGDRLVGLLGKLTELLKDPNLKAGFSKLGKSIGDFAERALPVIIKGFTWVVNNMDTIVAGIGGLAAAFVAAKLAAIGLALAAAPALLVPTLIAAAVVAIIAALVFLQLRFQLLSKAWEALKVFFTETLPQFMGAAFTWIGEKLTWLKNNFWETVGFIIGFFATLPIKIPFLVAQAIGAAISWLAKVDWMAVLVKMAVAFSDTWKNIKQGALDLLVSLARMNWGEAVKSIGKGIANGVMGLIEGVINGALSGIPGVGKVKLPRFAMGTNFAPGGAAIVGERGPEVVNLPRGSQVIPNNKLDSLVSGGDGVTVNQYNTVNNNVDMNIVNRKLTWELARA